MAPKEAGKGSSASGQSAEDSTYTGKADNYVPTFSGRQSDYREFRKRCDIYSAKMKIAKRQSETVFNIATLLAGRAWDVVEDLTVDELSAPDAYDKVFGRLDATFKYEPITELPSDFESFFIGLQRRGGQTVQDYQTEFMRVERRLTNTHKIQLPEKVRAWWFLRRSGLSKEQRQLVLTQLGESNLTLDRTMKAMNFIIGQDTKLDHAQSRWSRTSYKDSAYVAQEDDDEWPEEDEVWLGEDESEEPADWGEDYYDGGGPVDEVDSQGPVQHTWRPNRSAIRCERLVASILWWRWCKALRQSALEVERKVLRKENNVEKASFLGRVEVHHRKDPRRVVAMQHFPAHQRQVERRCVSDVDPTGT